MLAGRRAWHRSACDLQAQTVLLKSLHSLGFDQQPTCSMPDMLGGCRGPLSLCLSLHLLLNVPVTDAGSTTSLSSAIASSHLLLLVQNYPGGDANAYQGRATHLDQTFTSAKQALQAKLESIRSTHTAVLTCMQPSEMPLPLLSACNSPAAFTLQTCVPAAKQENALLCYKAARWPLVRPGLLSSWPCCRHHRLLIQAEGGEGLRSRSVQAEQDRPVWRHWQQQGVLSVTAHTGYQIMPVGLTSTSKPASQVCGLVRACGSIVGLSVPLAAFCWQLPCCKYEQPVQLCVGHGEEESVLLLQFKSRSNSFWYSGLVGQHEL